MALLSIDRKTRTTKADTVKVRDGSMLQTRPAEFLSGISLARRVVTHPAGLWHHINHSV